MIPIAKQLAEREVKYMLASTRKTGKGLEFTIIVQIRKPEPKRICLVFTDMARRDKIWNELRDEVAAWKSAGHAASTH